MGLEPYQEKRDLTKSGEPAPLAQSLGAVLTFVVHKHAASHLHYDFRLELDGVLKSWAIPKGPTLDPSIKRLAMMVEDHPYEYGKFEGVIPKGNYGAGEVIIWDEGTYRHPTAANRQQSEELLRQGLRKGDLKFVLDGQKLKGEFALVRIKSDKDNSWLLIKKHDQFASSEDVTTKDRSVVSNLSIQELKEGKAVPKPIERSEPEKRAEVAEPPKSAKPAEPAKPEKPSKSKGVPVPETAPSAPMPHQVRPMLATSVKDPFDDPDWLFEIKHDGYRCIAEIEKGKVLLYSRNNLSFNQRFAGVVQALEGIDRDAVLDGEVVALDDKGRSYFQLLQNNQRTGQGTISYFVFDLLYLDGKDLRSLPLLTRKELLSEILPDLPSVRYSDHIIESGRDFFDIAKANSLEGILAKRSSSQYQTGRRSRDWLKIKLRLQQEAVICGFTQPRGSRKNFGSLVLGVYENDELIYIGLTGGGFDESGLKQMYSLLQPQAQPDSPFKKRVKTDMPIQWVKPQLVCEVEFSEWTDERLMRQPIFLGLREDKDPKAVVREEFSSQAEPGVDGDAVREEFSAQGGKLGVAAGGQEESATATEGSAPDKENPATDTDKTVTDINRKRTAKDQVVVIDGNRLELTNLDKVFWPEEGFTKGDVIDYYRKVARAMLPHLKDRPESMYRTPHGITQGGFFQKEAGELPPPWMKTKEIYSKHVDKNIKFLVCQDEATLVYLANLGCIEINPWLSRLQSLNFPDYFVIDLDPEDISFDKVIGAALAVHEVLDKAGAPSYPKTSGASGMHIYVPLGAQYDYDSAEKFARVVVTLVHQKVPEFTSLLRSPPKRQKKVYLDFLQNKAGQTIAAPYSIRPRPGATVSAPLKWEEVKLGLHPSQFTIQTMPLRLEEVGDLFSGVLGPGIDIESCIEKLEK
jgi:bifunctional non-homologous end joining protein LigD